MKTILYLLLLVSAVGAVAVPLSASPRGWEPIEPAALAGRMVGDEITSMQCCQQGDHIGCGALNVFNCISNPLCYAGDTFDDECQLAKCTPNSEPYNKCSSSSSSRSVPGFTCRLTGAATKCDFPENPNLYRCNYDLIDKEIHYVGCNSGFSLCANQRPHVCP